MIQIVRARKPDVLAAKENKWKAEIRAAATPKARETAQNRYQHREIKTALVQMFHGKCAYCESAITHIDYGHIEHFKPKAVPAYFELAVDWDNLLLACGRCNGVENKGVKFPGSTEGGPLIDLTEEDPDQHLHFDFDVTTKLANIVSRTGRGETTWRILGLNRPELVHRRSLFVKKLWVIATFYDRDSVARDIIDAAVRDEAEYAAFARVLKRVVDARRRAHT